MPHTFEKILYNKCVCSVFFHCFLEPEAKRKSKWDQRGVTPPLLLPYQLSSGSGVLPPSFTTSASGTKSTVINAFGNINTRKK